MLLLQLLIYKGLNVHIHSSLPLADTFTDSFISTSYPQGLELTYLLALFPM